MVRIGHEYYLAAKLPLCMDYGLPLSAANLTAQWADEVRGPYGNEWAPDMAATMIAKIESL